MTEAKIAKAVSINIVEKEYFAQVYTKAGAKHFKSAKNILHFCKKKKTEKTHATATSSTVKLTIA